MKLVTSETVVTGITIRELYFCEFIIPSAWMYLQKLISRFNVPQCGFKNFADSCSPSTKDFCIVVVIFPKCSVDVNMFQTQGLVFPIILWISYTVGSWATNEISNSKTCCCVEGTQEHVLLLWIINERVAFIFIWRNMLLFIFLLFQQSLKGAQQPRPPPNTLWFWELETLFFP